MQRILLIGPASTTPSPPLANASRRTSPLRRSSASTTAQRRSSLMVESGSQVSSGPPQLDLPRQHSNGADRTNSQDRTRTTTSRTRPSRLATTSRSSPLPTSPPSDRRTRDSLAISSTTRSSSCASRCTPTRRLSLSSSWTLGTSFVPIRRSTVTDSIGMCSYSTHGVHMSQKSVELVSTREGTRNLTVTGPVDSKLLPPGSSQLPSTSSIDHLQRV